MGPLYDEELKEKYGLAKRQTNEFFDKTSVGDVKAKY